MANDPVVRDGRIDEDKLAELRAIGGETESLDFKRTANLQEVKARLAIVKDFVSIANSGGGFLIIGCDDYGAAATDFPAIVSEQWEPATLMGIAGKYLSAPLLLNARVHSVDGHLIAIVAIQPSMRSLPISFVANGEWKDEHDRSRSEFREGQIWIRSGPRNTLLDFHDWDRILERHDEDVREQVRGENRDLVDRVLEAIRHSRDDGDGDGGAKLREPTGRSPLVPGMSWDSLDRGIEHALDAPRDFRLRKYVRDVEAEISNPDANRESRQRAITELVNLAVQADVAARPEVLELALGALHKAYGALDGPQLVRDMSGVRDVTITNYWLDIATRVLALGAYFVRQAKWGEARSAYARTYAPEGDLGYVFQSWLRHAQVQGSRAELLRDANGRDGGAIFLSFAREVAVEEPRLRPDITAVMSLDIGSAPQGRDELLDSIAQFDALCTVMSEAGVTEGQAEHYPSFASLKTERALPILERIATDPALRTEAFAGISDAAIASALVRTLEVAHRESWRSAGVWFVPTAGPIAQFVASTGTTSIS